MSEIRPLDYRHAKVQRLRRLVARRTARDAEGVVVVEGAKILSEAMQAGVVIETVFVCPDIGASAEATRVVDEAFGRGARVHILAPGVLERVAGTVTPQPVLAVVRAPTATLQDVAVTGLLVVCIDVRDPGNAGTVLRSAEASGAGGVICCDGTVDVFNPKCVRASAGAVFHVPVVRGGESVQVLEELRRRGMVRLGMVARGGTPYTDVDLTGPTAIVLGNEALGLQDAARALLDASVTIPMLGRSDSLNVGMAAAVVCFEAARQRALSTPATRA